MLGSEDMLRLPAKETMRARRSVARISRAAVHLVLLSASAIPVSYVQASNPLDNTKPIRLHPDNPHYFEWRGKPTVLITASEHYGAVINRDFDYKKYLKTLSSYGFNLTRIFTGAYCESPGDFGIRDNTLAPAKGRLICPWARSDKPGYAFGGYRFDLSRWDPDYFERLRDFVAEAGRQGIVVEVVIFCTFYADSMWNLSPLNAKNNVDGIGAIGRLDVYTLASKRMTAVQVAMTRKIVTELRDFDNVYYEICNEPYERSGQTEAWQAQIVETIVKTEAEFSHKHLIAQGLPWKDGHGSWPKGVRKKVNPLQHVSILNFHGGPSPVTPLRLHYGLNKAIAYDETPSRGTNERYRAEGWQFIFAGGAVYNSLMLAFTVGHEDGTSTANSPCGGPALYQQLAVLKDFIHSLDFVEMKPDDDLLSKENSSYRGGQVLAKKGEVYAIYLPSASPSGTLNLSTTSGAFQKRWYDPRNGRFEGSTTAVSGGGSVSLGKPPGDASKDWVVLLTKKDDTKNNAARIPKGNSANPAGLPVNGLRITDR